MGDAVTQSRAGSGERLRRVGISIFIVVSLLAVLVYLLPDSALQRKALKVAHPYAAALGLDQGWGVFAPDPRPQTIAMRARILYSNGTTEWWDMPDGDPVIGDYWDYRWRKWLEYIVNNSYSTILFEPLAAWIARTHHDRTQVPVRITFVGRWFDLYPPGMKGIRKGQLRSDWRESAYYSIPVTPAMLKG